MTSSPADPTPTDAAPRDASAIQIRGTGGPEQLEFVSVDVAEPGPGQALVEVHAAGVNFIDTYHRSGLYPVELPFTPGSEGAGVVVALGPGAADGESGLTVGDRVAWVGVGSSYATHVTGPAESFLPVPAEMTLDVAAALPLQGMTAHYLVSDTHPLQPGETCLIHAAAGGTGRLLVQMAKLRGATVVATAGSPEKLDLARSAGADHLVNYVEEDLVDAVEAAVGPDAVNAVYDGVGAATFDAGIQLLAPRGTMATFGNASGAVPPVSPLTLMPKSLFLTRPSLFAHIATTEERMDRWNELAGWVRNGALEVRVGHTFPLADAADAHRALEGRSTTGKILLTN
ncbi:MAG: quinone oxidoreductase [Actinomycetota bacterium]